MRTFYALHCLTRRRHGVPRPPWVIARMTERPDLAHDGHPSVVDTAWIPKGREVFLEQEILKRIMENVRKCTGG